MKKTETILIIIATIVSFIGITAFAAELPVKVIVNGTEVLFPDVQPFIDENGRTLVPVRFVSQGLGALVHWDDKAKIVTITKGKDIVSLTIGKKAIKVNGYSKDLDTAAILEKERTFVPVRFVSEALGEKVEWDDATNTVKIGGELEDNAESLTYFRVGEWIYFSNTNYSSSIFKIKVDGEGRQRLNYDNSTIFAIEEDWIYYLNVDEQKLYKIKTDGSQKILISDFSHTSNPSYLNFVKVVDGWVYYTDNFGGLYKIYSPEKKGRLGDKIENVIITNDRIFYLTNDSIHSMSLDGIKDQIIVPSGVTNYGLYTNWNLGEWIYYKNYSTDEVFIVNTYTNKKVKLPIKMLGTDIVQIRDNWVYYVINNYSDSSILYRIKTDGTHDMKIVEMEQNCKPIIKDNWIYYNNYSNFISNLYKIKLDGTQKTKISDDGFSFGEMFIEDVEDNCIYYGSSMYNSITLYRVKVDGSEKSKLWAAHNNYDGGS